MKSKTIDWTTTTITQEAIATVEVECCFDVDGVDAVQDMLGCDYGHDAVTVSDTGILVRMPAERLLSHREDIEASVDAVMS